LDGEILGWLSLWQRCLCFKSDFSSVSIVRQFFCLAKCPLLISALLKKVPLKFITHIEGFKRSTFSPLKLHVKVNAHLATQEDIEAPHRSFWGSSDKSFTRPELALPGVRRHFDVVLSSFSSLICVLV